MERDEYHDPITCRGNVSLTTGDPCWPCIRWAFARLDTIRDPASSPISDVTARDIRTTVQALRRIRSRHLTRQRAGGR